MYRFFALFFFTILFISQSYAFNDKSIIIKTLVNKAGEIERTHDALPFLTDFVEISDDVLAVAYHDEKNIYLAFSTKHKMLVRSLKEVGLSLKLKGKKSPEFSIKLQPTEGRAEFRRPIRIVSGIEPLLPKHVTNQIREFMPGSEYAAYLSPDNRRRGGQLMIPDLDALYQDSSSIVVMRIPLQNPGYPAGILPFDKKGKLKVEVEIGDEFFTRGFMNSPNNIYSVRSQRQQSSTFQQDSDEIPPFGYEKFTVELLFDHLPDVLKGSIDRQPDFNLNAYLELLDSWSAETTSNRGGFRGRGGGRGGAAGFPPIAVQALFASETVVKSGIEYVSTFLGYPESEREQIYQDFSAQWETGAYFPVLVTMRTNLHESYLDRSRWTIFLEDKDRNQYEATKVVDVTDRGARTATEENNDEKRIQRPVFSSLTKKLVMLFPKENNNGESFWQEKNAQITLVVLSTENPEQRLEAKWRIPK